MKTLLLCSVVVAVGLLLSSVKIVESDRILNIAHRGSSGFVPEHTVEAYTRAVKDGAEYIECDLELTSDMQFICRHEPLLSVTTDVAEHVQFADRKRTYEFKGRNVTDWFTVDFTLAEVKQLRTKQRFNFRDQQFNGQYSVSTFDEFVAVAKHHNVGIYPEIKTPEFYANVNFFPAGVRVEDLVLRALEKHGFTSAEDPCIVQSFSEEALTYVSSRTHLRLAMLAEEPRTVEDVRRYAAQGFHAFSVSKQFMVEYSCDEDWPATEGRHKDSASKFVTFCHELGLIVHVFTLRNEDRFISWEFEQDVYKELAYFIDSGVDGIFTDFPSTLDQYLDCFSCSFNPNRSKATSNFYVALLFLCFCLIVPLFVLC